MNNTATKIFKYRSYTPIPFVILMLIFENATITSLMIGFIIAVVGEFVRFWGVSWAGSETRTTGGVGGTYLVISGPFAYVRNPLYVGNILMYFGLGIMSMALFPYLQIVAITFFIIQYNFIVKEEEGFLEKKFGNNYHKYLQNVPRFFPRVTKFKDNSIPQPNYKISAGLKSETRTLQAFAAIVFLILIKWYLSSNNIL
jgi:protein-S-isoprenylcysteine O-methyltransferase Ste14